MRIASRDAAVERYFVGFNEEFHPYRKEYAQEELELFRINFRSETFNDIVPMSFSTLKPNSILAVLPPDTSASPDQALGFVKLFVFFFSSLFIPFGFIDQFALCFLYYTVFHSTVKQKKLVFFFLLVLFHLTDSLLEGFTLKTFNQTILFFSLFFLFFYPFSVP